MQIVPVLDLLGGQIVRAVAGRRSEYRPIESGLVRGADPRAVAQAIVDQLLLREMYLADLDAIQGGEPCWGIYEELLSLGVRLWIDAGVSDLARATQVAQIAAADCSPMIVAGLESIPDRVFLRRLIERAGADRVIFSLDLVAGRPKTNAEWWNGATPLDVAGWAMAQGATRLLILDLAYVGLDDGPVTLELCRTLRNAAPHLWLATGGGVRNPNDLHSLKSAGCDAVLVASAIHSGKLTAEGLATFRGEAT